MVLMESTGIYWAETFYRLSEAGLNVVVGNAHEIKNAPGHQTDIGDSRWLANIARFDLIRHSRILPKEYEEVRELARMRQDFVEEKARLKNRFERALRQRRVQRVPDRHRCLRKDWPGHC
ncbi:MAG: IS110 family transposase [Deltaproteobacteria bacterium]|jgi:transposase|nr:IS110 family transposase [Deltaproteobacteria bacterium]